MNTVQRIFLKVLRVGGFPTAMAVVVMGLGLDRAMADGKPAQATPADAAAKAQELLEQLDRAGVTIRMAERYVDVDSVICLRQGMLELIACTKDTKEHEAIIAVEAKAAHIHAALLLLGGRPGNPAMRKQVGEEQRWIDVPPSGSNIDVFLVIKGEDGKTTERPIKDFLMRAEEDFGVPQPEKKDPAETAFPTHTFLFAGSHLLTPEGEKARYLSDESGNVITLATFGDELLCLPGMHAHDNGGLVWEVDPTHLPPLGTKVALRLRPQVPGAAAVKPVEEPEKE